MVFNTVRRLILLLPILCVFIACSKVEKQAIPLEGETVTWKITSGSELIIHTVLKERLILTKEHKKSIYYRPEQEKYLGQFAIDYVPPKLKKITAQEALALPVKSGDLRFNLMLNGAKVQAKGYMDFIQSELDHKDQVQVILSNQPMGFNPLALTKEYYVEIKNDRTKIYDPEFSKKYGLECFKNRDINQLECFGKSSNKRVSGVLFRISRNLKNKVIAYSIEPQYGAIKVEWQIDLSNLKHWKEVDANIWRLLEAWNISPTELNDNHKFTDHYKKGDLVAWEVTPELMIKTKLGEREITPYKYPSTRRFLGQFSIDSKPQNYQISKLDSVEQASDREHPMEFNLLLNGQKNLAIHGFYNKNIENQVKVLVTNLSELDKDQDVQKNARTPRDWIDYLLSTGYVKNDHLSETYHLECYSLKNKPAHISRLDHCIGRSNSPEKNDFILKIYEALDNKIIVNSTVETKSYGHISVEWQVPVSSLKDWNKIDQNIWRLLEVWNVRDNLN